MSDNYKTTVEHFELFKAEVKHNLKEFGLLDWRVVIEHKDTKEKDDYGSCTSSLVGKLAVIRLSVSWDEEVTYEAIRRVAFHEVCELLLAELGEVWQWSLSSDGERNNLISKLKHDVIRRLENRYFEAVI